MQLLISSQDIRNQLTFARKAVEAFNGVAVLPNKIVMMIGQHLTNRTGDVEISVVKDSDAGTIYQVERTGEPSAPHRVLIRAYDGDTKIIDMRDDDAADQLAEAKRFLGFGD